MYSKIIEKRVFTEYKLVGRGGLDGVSGLCQFPGPQLSPHHSLGLQSTKMYTAVYICVQCRPSEWWGYNCGPGNWHSPLTQSSPPIPTNLYSVNKLLPIILECTMYQRGHSMWYYLTYPLGNSRDPPSPYFLEMNIYISKMVGLASRKYPLASVSQSLT